ncbi:MAG: M56 family metallopeptidase [Planctomycetaceae bacterium]|nr:M56 family metallopeptidase [Planctomycetaceae bacterium]
MTLLDLTTLLAMLLCTYLVHSTILLAATWWLCANRRWPDDPGLRSQLLKLSLLAPLITTVGVTYLQSPHWGHEILLTRSTASANMDGAAERAAPQTQLSESPTDSSISAPFDSIGSGAVTGGEPFGEPLAASPATFDSASQTVSPLGLAVREWTFPAIVLSWLFAITLGLFRLAMHWRSLLRLRHSATAIVHQDSLEELDRLRQRMGIRQHVDLLASAQTQVPLAAGILRPFILLPTNLDGSSHLKGDSQFSAMLAHELAHVARRDSVWNLLLQLVCRVGFFQPLNWLVSREVRQQMDFSADALAARALGEPMSLVRCLYATGKRLSNRRKAFPSSFALASGMALFESTLGQRVDALLNMERNSDRQTSWSPTTILILTTVAAALVSVLAPRAVVVASNPQPSSDHRNDDMNKSLASMLVLAGLSIPASAEDPTPSPEKTRAEVAPLKTTPDELPDGVRGFNGMLVGRLAAKDAERGTFTVLVDAVPRVWRNSSAEDPRRLVGKTITVTGVFGKFLDVLVVTRVGETVEFECKHDGDILVFPGELLRKVAPYDPADYPVLPEEFRGFQGQLAAKILKKDPETFELILHVDRVVKTWDDSSAKNPQSIEGKTLMLAGFWNRREAYHDLKVGERIEVGMKHIGMRSDHLTVAEAIKKTGKLSDTLKQGDGKAMSRRESMERKDPQRGFRGMLVGRLVEKDAERGTFTVTVDAVPRVWENNRSSSPKSLIGKNVSAEGVSGRMIDALVVARIGDTIEFGALHDEGPRVRVGEVLRKVAPVKPGDYPVLPDEFRGFKGAVTAKVVRKGDELWELIVEVEKVHETFEGNRAKSPESIVGEQLMLAGFWNRKDEFHNIKVGDRIRCGMNHPQLLSDHMTVIEGIRKLQSEAESE